MTCVAKYDFSIPQGTDLSVPFRLKDSEGVPVRLEGFSVRMQLRRFVTASDVIDELSTDNGRVTLDDNWGGVLAFISERCHRKISKWLSRL